MTDFIAANFGLLELLLFVELVVLATAGVFYPIAKLASGHSRHDPMVRFYHVFWRGFFADVTAVGVLRARQAEVMARRAGVVAIGDPSPEQLAALDAPDLHTIAGTGVPAAAVDAPARPPTRSAGTASTATAGDATLDLRIIGRSETNAVAGHDGPTLIIRVRGEIEDGQTNGVVVELAAHALQIPVQRIVLLRGHYRSDKAFRVSNMDQADLDMRVRATGPTASFEAF